MSNNHELKRLERVAVATEVANLLRDDMRGKLAGIRSATSYIKDSLRRTGRLGTDPRVGQFLDLIVHQLEEANAVLAPQHEETGLLQLTPSESSLDSCVLDVASRWNQERERISVELSAPDRIIANWKAVEFCIDRMIEAALEGDAARSDSAKSKVRIVTRFRVDRVYVYVGDGSRNWVRNFGTRGMFEVEPPAGSDVKLDLSITMRFLTELGGEFIVPETPSQAPGFWLPLHPPDVPLPSE